MGDDWLGSLSTTDVRRLHEALRVGIVKPGCSPELLRHQHLPDTWASPLAEMAATGWTAATLTQAVGWLIEERERAEQSIIHLVSTQPGVAEKGFVETSVVLRQLFEQAEEEVLIAGYRITSRETLEHLRRREAKKLDVHLFCDLDPAVDVRGKRRPSPLPVTGYPQRWWSEFLGQTWPEAMDPPAAYYAPLNVEPGDYGWNLMHVKTVVVDRKRCFVTSANLTYSGQHKNMELGVVLNDTDTAGRVIRHFENLVDQEFFVPIVAQDLNST